MAIFSNKYSRGTVVPVREASLSTAADMVMEASTTANNLISALYVSDVVIESKVLFEGASPEILVEATIKEIYKKFIDALVKLKNKIVAWFKKLFENIKARFTKNKDFVKKYRSKIVKAAQNNVVTLSGYEYNVQDVNNKFSSIVAAATSFASGAYTANDAKDTIAEKFQDITRATGTSVGDIKSAIMDSGKSKNKISYEMTASLVNKFLSEIDSESKVLKDIETAKNNAVKVIDATIKAAQKESSKSTHELTGARAQEQISALNYVSSVITTVATTVAKIVEMSNKQASSLLKGVFLKRKESTEMLADEIVEPEVPDEEIDELVESAIETVGQDVATPVADEEVTDVMDDTMDETVVSTDPEDASETDSVLAEAFSALGI